EGYRGQGIFDGLYRKMQVVCASDYDFTVTEIAARNTRSLRAHERVGFETLHVYDDPLTGETWHVVGLGMQAER
ncbi:MAG: GNAT family N-acetyltransferase, partial [Saprospiraceae bacterium]